MQKADIDADELPVIVQQHPATGGHCITGCLVRKFGTNRLRLHNGTTITSKKVSICIQRILVVLKYSSNNIKIQ